MTVTPMAVVVKLWRCPCCGRKRAGKQAMVQHIARCWFNAENRACKTCVHRFELSRLDGPDAECGKHVDLGPSGRDVITNCDSWSPSEPYAGDEDEGEAP